MAKGNPSKPLVAFMYLGRRGALGRFTLQLAQAAAHFEDYDFEFIIFSIIARTIISDAIRFPISVIPQSSNDI